MDVGARTREGSRPGSKTWPAGAETLDQNLMTPPAVSRRIESVWGRTIRTGLKPSMTLKVAGPNPPARGRLNLQPVRVARPGEPVSPQPPQYVLGQLLGRGGMGVVYEAVQTCLDRVVALKMIPRKHAADPGHKDRFLSEAAVTGELDHPNIPPVHEAAADEQGVAFYAMKKVTGTPWSRAIRGKSLTENLQILLDVCDAVAFAHSRGVLHRDLKPGNVMLGEFGEVLVIDWGLAVSFSEGGRARRLGGEPGPGGTPAYMAPEMALGQAARIGPASDVYLLGAILHEIVTGRAPHHGRSVRQCLQNAGRNRIVRVRERGELLEIALKAMATEPKDRYAGVKGFQQAVRDYLAHAQSLELTHQAEEELTGATKSKRYDAFAEAISGFKQAMKLWSENPRAREGLAGAKLAYAETALERGDLDLAESLLEGRTPRHEEVRRKILAAREGDWIEVHRQDFTRPDADLSGLSFCVPSEPGGCEPAPVGPGGIRMPGVGEMFWLRNLRIRGDVKVEVELVWDDCVDGVEIFLNTRREQTEGSGIAPLGYSCQFGGYVGTENLISRNESSRPANRSSAVPASFEPGRPYRLSFDRREDRLTLQVDGVPVHQKLELLPLVGTGLEWVGVLPWSQVHIRSVAVFRRSLPQKASPVVAGDALYEAGHQRDAVRAYRTIAGDFPGTAIAEKSLAKAYLAACGIPRGMARAEARIRAEMEQAFPNSPYLLRFDEADCLRAWQDGRYRQALDLLPGIFQRNPQTRVVVEILDGRHEPLPEGIGHELLTWGARTRGIRALDLSELGLADLGALAGMDLAVLNCGNNRLTDLRPLKGMQLRSLGFSDNHVADLSPLKGMPLTQLKCSNNGITSLRPLRGMKLRSLVCGENHIATLDPVKGMPLSELRCNDNPMIASLDPLRGMPLRFLNCACTGIASLEALRDMPLVYLHIGFTRAASLSPLKGMSLGWLACDFSSIGSLLPLRGMPLRVLYCDHNRVASLEPLRGMPLAFLDCDDNQVATLEPLKGMQLRQLRCSHNRITSLRPLEGMPLARLECPGNPFTDLKPFEDDPPEQFLFDTDSLPDEYVESILNSWEESGRYAGQARQNRVARAVRRGDAAAARALAQTFQGHRCLLAGYGTWEQANLNARRIGGHLVTITSPEEQDFVLSLLGYGRGTWLGLCKRREGDVWVTGEPVTYARYRSESDRDSDLPRGMFKGTWGGQWHVVRPVGLETDYIVEWDD